MPWIDIEAVEPLVRTDLSSDQWIDGIISHAQALAENLVGEQDTPSAGLQAVLANVVARMWRAGHAATVNPAGFQSETSPEYGYSVPTGPSFVAGLGLTNQEKRDLKKAAGVSALWVQPTTRGTLETATAPAGWRDWDDPAS